MLKIIPPFLLATALALSLPGCGAPVQDIPAGSSSGGAADTDNPGGTDDGARYTQMILTREQMLEEYDAMWAVLEAEYPFWGVVERRGTDRHAIVERYRRRIADIEQEGDEAMVTYLFDILQASMDEVMEDPHAGVLSGQYRSSKAVYNELAADTAWAQTLNRPQVEAFYDYYDHTLIPILLGAQGREEISPTELEAQLEEARNQAAANLSTEIIEEGRVAYIKAASFANEYMEADLPKIRSFLEEVADYEHLIIDLQGNGGGNTDYWEEAFVRPNIPVPYSPTTFRLIRDTDLAQRFYGSYYADSGVSADAVRANPALGALPGEDLDGRWLARENSYTIDPEVPGSKLFGGEIWVLTDPSVYSSAEAFAVFCKATGFATLVGGTTGGGNTGGPVYCELPISHTIVQFDVEYCLNPNGSCSQETGTAPDIASEDPLQAVLERIG